MYYAQELIEEIRIQNDIVDVISEYIPLKQKGGSYFGLCPFHNEGTPSFSVNAEKQFYYCFGCGAAGNVYSFIMQMENCDFIEAVTRLADRVHITLPEPEQAKEAQEGEKLRQALLEIHKTAGRFYYEQLQGEKGVETLEYLKKRQILPNIQKKFGIGYSPTVRDLLYRHLEEKGFKIEAMLKSGLVMENKNGKGYHDRFYSRLMFPIFDVQGRVIAFGGRIMESGEPKYLNSPETMIFSKSRNLYGLNFARASKKKEIIIVEGYMDMISIYQAGFHNVVASLGTAFNNEHAKVLKKFVTDIILLFDSDDAGTNAALRAIPILVANGFRVRVVQVPNGKDPDDFMKQYGAQEFSKLLVHAESYISFQVNCIRKQYNIQNTEEKVLFTTEAAKILSKLASDIERDVYTKEVAAYTGIAENAIKNEISKIIGKAEKDFIEDSEKKRIHNYSQKSVNITQKSKGVMEAQRDILFICATNRNICFKIKPYLEVLEYSESVYQKLAELIYYLNEKNDNIFPAEIVNHFQSIEEQKMVTEVFAVQFKYDNNKDLEKAINEEVKLIKKTNIDIMAAEVNTIDGIQKLLEVKKKLDEMYISISEG